MTGRTGQVLALGTTQTIAWAGSTYLPAILATPIAQELGVARVTVFGAFSVALVVMALFGPPVGRVIDAGKGRGLLVASNLVLAAGLAMLGAAGGEAMLFAAWCVIGVGMGMGLYDSAFAILVRLHGSQARGAITGITLIAGFASTVGWPLTAWLDARYGWREAQFRSMWEEAQRLHRSMKGAWFWNLIGRLFPKSKREEFRRFSGIVLLERV